MIAAHGVHAPRGQDAATGSRAGRFGRMFGHLPACDPGQEAIDALVAMIEQAGERATENRDTPAAYTYLGQFIDHDITFDPTSKLQRDNDPAALVNFRTPRFDLDSLYGSGPADQPYLYDWNADPHPGVKLLVGRNGGDPSLAAVDLPRNQDGRALIGDARNDENVIVAQVHLLLLRFHNKVVDWLSARDARPDPWDMFELAQRLVRWHYQWIVVHDFLERVVGAGLARAVLEPAAQGRPPRVRRRFYETGAEPAMPVEFSAAAYRFGHSMVRADYPLHPGAASVPVFTRADTVRHMGGFRPLPRDLSLDWPRFLSREIPSMRIDRSLAPALLRLPPDDASLPRLNLERGRALGLPSGGDVARAMGVTPLAREDLLLDDEVGKTFPDAVRDALWRATPLWYYVLCEARSPAGDGGKHLGPVGGRIVAEVLAGLLEADPHSYLRQWPAWTPAEHGLAGAANFTLGDLVEFTLA